MTSAANTTNTNTTATTGEGFLATIRAELLAARADGHEFFDDDQLSELVNATGELAGELAHNAALYSPHFDHAMRMGCQPLAPAMSPILLAWLVQAHAIACFWQAEDQEDCQDSDGLGGVLRGRSGHEAQCEASEAIRALDPSKDDWDTVEYAKDRLNAELADWFSWLSDRGPGRPEVGPSIEYHRA